MTAGDAAVLALFAGCAIGGAALLGDALAALLFRDRPEDEDG